MYIELCHSLVFNEEQLPYKESNPFAADEASLSTPDISVLKIGNEPEVLCHILLEQGQGAGL